MGNLLQDTNNTVQKDASDSIWVLIAEDSLDDAELLVRELRRGGLQVEWQRVETEDELRVCLQQQSWDLIISDHIMPQFTSTEALRVKKELGLDTPFILVSGKIDELEAVEIMRMGCQDYVAKNNLTRLCAVVYRELEEAAIRQQNKKNEEMIKYLAFYDPLTELPNRYNLLDIANQAMEDSKMEEHQLVIMLLEIESYKKTKYTLGHTMADYLLQVIADELGTIIKNEHVIGKYAENEFLILLKDISNKQEAIRVAADILHMFDEERNIGNNKVFSRGNIGIVFSENNQVFVDELFRQADIAMFKAREKGCNQYQIYNELIRESELAKINIEIGIRNALKDDCFHLVFQPQINVETQTIIAFEALLRCNNELARISPMEYIAVAEETGLIIPIGTWVLRNACEQIKVIEQQGHTFAISINIAANQLMQKNFVDEVIAVVEALEIDPAHLQIEITESMLMTSLDIAIEKLQALKEYGIKIALDDFGTCYSSLNYLRQLPIDILKIDKCFIDDIGGNKDIVAEIIAIGRKMGIEVVAEGVETAKQLQYLTEHQCDIVQGYLFSRPLPIDQLIDLLNKHNDKLPIATS
jgi:diguanylate cyclase (GGDEF)-like protein